MGKESELVLTAGVARRGDWLLLRRRDHTLAYHLRDETELRLTGELATSVWKQSRLLDGLAALSGDFADLTSTEVDTAPLTLQDLLAPEGWGHLFLELTGQCNERCLHCYADSSPEVETALDWATIETCLKDAAGLGFRSLQFTGGDPLVSPHIVPAVHTARALGDWRIEVYTNALALREPLIELFRAKGVHVASSVYSHDPVVHDRVTGVPGSHERTIRHLQAALRAGLQVRVGAVQGCADGQDEAALRAFLIEVGIAGEHISSDRQRQVGRGQWSEETKLLPTQSPRSPGHARSTRFGKLSISYTGEVVPCIFDRRTSFGSVHDERLSQILRKAILSRASARGLELVGEPLACSDCQKRRELLRHLEWRS